MINPWAAWPVTCDWACHVAAGNSDLGTDLGCPVGTPIVAAFDGTLSNGTRQEPAPFKVLYIAILRSDESPNLSFEHMHLSRFAPPGHYKAGDVIGWTGGARYQLGSGQATGPHLHVNAIINGRLAPIYTAFTEFASTTITPLPNGAPTMSGPMQIRNDGTTGAYAGEIGLLDLSGYRKVNDLHAAGVLIPLAQNLETTTPARPWTGYSDVEWAELIVAVTGHPRVYWDTNLPGGSASSDAAALADLQGQVAQLVKLVQGITSPNLAPALDAITTAITTMDGHVQAIRVPTKLTGTLG